jgi:hypothetical protein
MFRFRRATVPLMATPSPAACLPGSLYDQASKDMPQVHTFYFALLP